MKKVLVTGGAGYIGSVLVRLLLKEEYFVRVLDNLSFGGESIVELFNYENFEFIKGDVRNNEDVIKAVNGMDYIVHLAAIVGDPACAKEPELAREINLEGSKRVYNIAEKSGVKKLLFASTCSNYGKMSEPDNFVDERSELSPVSLYAETKVAFEEFLLSQSRTNTCKPTCARFSTVYGYYKIINNISDSNPPSVPDGIKLTRKNVQSIELSWRPSTDAETKVDAYKIYRSDPDAHYAALREYDVSNIFPQVSLPHIPSNAKDVRTRGKIEIDQVIIGSCTNGHLDDLRMAAKILRGKKVAPSVRMIVIPATPTIYRQALKEKLAGMVPGDRDPVVGNRSWVGSVRQWSLRWQYKSSCCTPCTAGW